MSSPESNRWDRFFLPAACLLGAAGMVALILLNAYLYPGPAPGHIPSLPELSEQEEDSSLVPVNRADLSQLMTLEGIGQTLAQRIIDHREAHGFFNSPEELLEVPGIGEATLSAIRDKICFS
ncbi:MAG: helix-hairpin-helix domain-containing protein [Ruminococcaceae bacterium]|nr:helix-hairpin-helix domain-containing protein [Oscillospiraceae bacterium]